VELTVSVTPDEGLHFVAFGLVEGVDAVAIELAMNISPTR
jgi:hypothetical protein